MKLKKIEIILCLALIISILFHFVSFAGSCASVKKDVLRLHIIANSDSKEDQALKLKVRDAVIKSGQVLFESAESIEQAKQMARLNLEKIKQTAVHELQKNHCADSVTVRLTSAFFETRYYDGFTLPAGEYEALQIIIGKGEGHNWWCVMFPELCFAAAGAVEKTDALNDAEKKLITSNPHVEVRFKCVEIYEKIKKIL